VSIRYLITDPRAAVAAASCEDFLATLPNSSIDALVTDPPAGIAFMGRAWDTDKGGRDAWVAWLAGIMRECMRVLKPGAHALVWALPRTSHWTATAVEDAGFEIRDVVMHLFGTGFPKGLNVSKAIDKAAGEATSDAAKKWAGWDIALKPAAEHWILARKPLVGTVAANVLAHGTGALNVDGCRIGTSKDVPASAPKDRIGQASKGDERGRTADTDGFDPNVGRWPANVTLDEEAAALLDEQSGERTSGEKRGGKYARTTGVHEGGQRVDGATCYADTGGASRFFYVAKGARSEKERGLDHLEPRTAGEATGRADDTDGLNSPRAGAGRTGGARNHHPTVKSISLMRWLCRLITPPGGVVLDPFAGSGSTGVAALAEGFQFIGCEQGGEGGEYWPILEGRIRHALGGK
jgi:site-specific DNA-methyltransferase (adenine-specific)